MLSTHNLPCLLVELLEHSPWSRQEGGKVLPHLPKPQLMAARRHLLRLTETGSLPLGDTLCPLARSGSRDASRGMGLDLGYAAGKALCLLLRTPPALEEAVPQPEPVLSPCSCSG